MRFDGGAIGYEFCSRIRLDPSGCWIWTGGKQAGYGYWQGEYAHRLMHAFAGHEIPSGWIVHHRCENKMCVNPEHLEGVSRQDHAAVHRPTHCKQGHEFAADNTYVDRHGRRRCKTCVRDQQRIDFGWQGGKHNRDKTHCKLGHPLAGANLLLVKGGRACRECRLQAGRDWYHRKKAASAA